MLSARVSSGEIPAASEDMLVQWYSKGRTCCIQGSAETTRGFVFVPLASTFSKGTAVRRPVEQDAG